MINPRTKQAPVQQFLLPFTGTSDVEKTFCSECKSAKKSFNQTLRSWVENHRISFDLLSTTILLHTPFHDDNRNKRRRRVKIATFSIMPQSLLQRWVFTENNGSSCLTNFGCTVGIHNHPPYRTQKDKRELNQFIVFRKVKSGKLYFYEISEQYFKDEIPLLNHSHLFGNYSTVLF